MVICHLTGFAEEVVTFDFSTNDWGFPTSEPAAGEYQFSDDEKTIKIKGKPYYDTDGLTILGYSSTIANLEFPGFDFYVTRIEIDVSEKANATEGQNIYIDSKAVSTKTTGGQGTYTYVIQEEYRILGAKYIIKPYKTLNLYISKIRVYGEKNYSLMGVSSMNMKLKTVGDGVVSSTNDDGFIFTFCKNTGTIVSAIGTDNKLKFYKGNTCTINAPSGKIITNISFEGSNENLTVNTGTFVSTTNTWSGLATNVTFENNTGSASYSNIKIIYSDLYSRTTTVDELGTICLDKDVKEEEYSGAKFYEISHLDGNKLYFEEVTSLNAGYPYLFQATDTEIKMAVHGNVSTEGKSKNGFHGVLTDFPFNGSGSGFVDGDYFVVTGNKIVAASNESGVRANRAFIVKSEIPTSAPTSDAKKNMICLDDDSNGISSIPSSDTDADIYDLSGRKVYKPAHGIYIKEGKKIIY